MDKSDPVTSWWLRGIAGKGPTEAQRTKPSEEKGLMPWLWNKEKHTQEIGKMERMPFTRRSSVSTVWGLWVQRKQGNWCTVQSWLSVWGSNLEHLLCSLRAGAQQLETKHSPPRPQNPPTASSLSQDEELAPEEEEVTLTHHHHIIHTTVYSSILTKLNTTVPRTGGKNVAWVSGVDISKY